MSHQPERKEKDCLNCGNIIYGRYCHVCGQENIIIKQGFWSLAKHFVYDIFHFDGKFFDTLRSLLLRPGLVPREFISGRRLSYLDPIRMYLFTSAVFFLIFFATEDITNVIRSSKSDKMTRTERFNEALEVSNQLKKQRTDSSLFYKLNTLLDTTKSIWLEEIDPKIKNDSFYVTIRNKHFHLTAETDSSNFYFISNKNNWFERKMEERWIEKKNKYGDDEKQLVADLSSEFMHKMPYLLFISLPFFALILKLLYVRRKNNFYYSDHAVFTLYHYIFSFILLLFYFGFESIKEWTQWKVFSWVSAGLLICWPIYLLVGMKKFYRQKWPKTLLKFLMVLLLGFLTMLILFTVFILISFIF